MLHILVCFQRLPEVKAKLPWFNIPFIQQRMWREKLARGNYSCDRNPKSFGEKALTKKSSLKTFVVQKATDKKQSRHVSTTPRKINLADNVGRHSSECNNKIKTLKNSESSKFRNERKQDGRSSIKFWHRRKRPGWRTCKGRTPRRHRPPWCRNEWLILNSLEWNNKEKNILMDIYESKWTSRNIFSIVSKP